MTAAVSDVNFHMAAQKERAEFLMEIAKNTHKRLADASG
jgi:hypothetical protein